MRGVVIIGPTGAGKSPLGKELEARGLGMRPCIHLDFGQLLRNAAENPLAAGLSRTEHDFVLKLLKEGLLLEDNDFLAC